MTIDLRLTFLRKQYWPIVVTPSPKSTSVSLSQFENA